MREADFIETLLRFVPHSASPAGPGDDAALLGARARVLTADALVEDTHFLRGHPPEWLGWKTLAVNLSDVNAMGSRPEAFALTAALPRNTPREWWERFASGLGEYARLTQTRIVGGDIVRSPGPICLSITAWGECPQEPLLRRDKADIGEHMMLAGEVGSAGIGLHAWLKQGKRDFWQGPLPTVTPTLASHLKPSPPLWAGPTALSLGARCGLDLSDGLVWDLERLARASQVSLHVDVDRLPLCTDAAKVPIEKLLGLGEDYSLLVCVPPRLTPKFENVGFVNIGRVLAGEASVLYERDGRRIEPQPPSFEHFED